MSNPVWLDVGYKYLGLKEIRGPKHSSIIVGWLDKLGAWWRDDETAWCGVFCANAFKESGYTYPKLYMRAKSWLNWGTPIEKPVLGCIVVFDRKGGGHVGFVVSYAPNGDILVLGGNQGNMVNISRFPIRRVLGYRVPAGWNYTNSSPLPNTAAVVESSTNEA